ncbi:dUTP pyrophosphatase [Anaerocolumna aminovalerica]|uniref:dUTP pyrophosphatase n=1 Tax=Anaerocolumna aminovalerica TaxID=1527 RepID=UPI001C0E9F69|nr:dUTP pyrophosphatase [Anaerocolumna aminovalerica]MBU5331702.1 dUTP pyrophosphatase [Anaerocolumna aminovalerica]
MIVGDKDVLFAKVKCEATIPSKRKEDGCYDIYACFDEKYMIIEPHQCKLIPTGLASAFSPKYRLAIRERGSNTKSTLITMAGQVDSGYRGEIFVALYNGNDIPVLITKDVSDVIKADNSISIPYSKAIAQFAMEEVPELNIGEITYQDLLMIDSERGTGALGSSNK